MKLSHALLLLLFSVRCLPPWQVTKLVYTCILISGDWSGRMSLTIPACPMREVELRRWRSRLGQQGVAILHRAAQGKRTRRKRPPDRRGASRDWEGREYTSARLVRKAKATGLTVASRCAQGAKRPRYLARDLDAADRQATAPGPAAARSTSWNTSVPIPTWSMLQCIPVLSSRNQHAKVGEDQSQTARK